MRAKKNKNTEAQQAANSNPINSILMPFTRNAIEQ
tara:strand:- start:1026 stop:1130 length:105 start_codon:yes stop_codon:yes gene_type:complete